MIEFVHGDFLGVGRHQRILERNLGAADHRALRSDAGHQVGGQTRAEYGVLVELGFEVFKVQGEIQYLLVGGSGRLGGGVVPAAASPEQGAEGHTRRHASGLAEEMPALLAPRGASNEKIENR